MATNPPTALERAFELAKSGTCASVSDIRAQLKLERYDSLQITGPSLLRQLRKLMAGAAQSEIQP